jgi:hypothetical protein
VSWGGPSFIIAIIAICTAGWVFNNWIRARHGYALEDEWGGKTERPLTDESNALREENRRLKENLAKLEERTVVLEKIVTDGGFRLTHEIEALRDKDSATG